MTLLPPQVVPSLFVVLWYCLILSMRERVESSSNPPPLFVNQKNKN